MEKKDVGEKLKALENSIMNIEKAFGKGSIMKLGSRKTIA
ncbi:MAG TPA: DNA recombination/repair protein RecA, partial [Spirochaetota bacterium]|nr:DNA recombination/repair protein RecA [Spirochaetota bacterium]